VPHHLVEIRLGQAGKRLRDLALAVGQKRALGVLGLGSLLLTQVRYEHPASIKDAEAQELATREAADMRRADSAPAQLIRDGLDGLPADPAGLN
jgi:hypothetical protein